MTNIEIILLVAGTAVAAASIATLNTSRKMRQKVTYMLDALEDKELNFRFDENRLIGRRFNKTLNRLRGIFDKERHEIIEQEKYFGLMLDHVQTGVVVVEDSGRVNYCNKTALTLLGVATFGHIRQLRSVSDSLYEIFRSITDGVEERSSYYNESGKRTIALTASAATIGKEHVRVIAFNDISNEIAENEQESWSKLIRVLTHEIMNTVTPIASLSETLLKFDNVDGEVRNGLSTISQSSRGLIKFVDTYRNLTRVAMPSKRAFYFRELAERVINLTREQTVISGAVCTYVEKSEAVRLYADEGQISKESQDEIFVPFFTTKQDGTGIGLSLSRQIMRLHNGTLSLTRSDASSTVFTLIFK